jgi:hypothetical protein
MANLVYWNDVKKDMGYSSTDDNKGFIFGIETLDDNEEILDISWFKTEEEQLKTFKEVQNA